MNRIVLPSSFQDLRLGGLSNDGACKLARALPSMKLEAMDISSEVRKAKVTPIQDGSVCELADALQLDTSMLKLAVAGHISFRGGRALSNALLINTSLVSLTLITFDEFQVGNETTHQQHQHKEKEEEAEGGATDSGESQTMVEGVALCLSSNSTLTELRLRNIPIIPINTAGLQTLTEGLKINTTLRLLEIDISDFESTLAIARSLQGWPLAPGFTLDGSIQLSMCEEALCLPLDMLSNQTPIIDRPRRYITYIIFTYIYIYIILYAHYSTLKNGDRMHVVMEGLCDSQQRGSSIRVCRMLSHSGLRLRLIKLEYTSTLVNCEKKIY